MNGHMNDDELRSEAAFRRLGTRTPRCVICGEEDWRCLEKHHIGREAFNAEQVILCRNCHRKQSNPADNALAPTTPPLMERIGQFLIGLVDLLLALLPKLREFGEELLRGAAACQWPWGWQEAPA